VAHAFEAATGYAKIAPVLPWETAAPPSSCARPATPCQPRDHDPDV